MNFLSYITKPQNKILKWAVALTFSLVFIILFWRFASPMYLHFWVALGLLVIFDILFYAFISRYLISNYNHWRKILYAAVYFLPLLLVLFACIIPLFIPYYDWHPVARSRFIGVIMVLSFTKGALYFVYMIGIIHFVIWKLAREIQALPIVRFFRPYVIASYILCVISLILFGLAFSYGERRIELEKVPVKISRLPKEFEGYKIVHISDFHLGSVSKKTVQKIVEIVNDQNPDIVCFTGDLVTYSSKEIPAFQNILNGIQTKDGIYAIFGNHDYGTYSQYKSAEEQEEEHRRIASYMKDSLHWNLLANESVEIKKGDSSAILIGGIENLSETERFVSRGDISLTFENKDVNIPVILLSHDPSIWSTQIIKNYPFIDLTLSGHTHGMQFGIPLGKGVEKEKGRLRKKEVRGIYSHDKQRLYVSKGIGSSLLHGRLGMWADVSVIILESGEN